MSPLLSGHIRLELHGAHERVRDQAGAFRFLEELPSLLGIGGRRDREKGPNRDARKSRGALDAIATDPSKFADASTLYRWGRLFIVFLLSEPGALS